MPIEFVPQHVRGGRVVRRYTRQTAKALNDYLRAVLGDIEERETYGYGPLIAVDSEESRYYLGRARDRAMGVLRNREMAGDTTARDAIRDAPQLATRVQNIIRRQHSQERRRQIEEIQRATEARIRESRQANRMMRQALSEGRPAYTYVPGVGDVYLGQRSETAWSRARHRGRWLVGHY